MLIYIARHGQTDWNARKTIQGHTDIPLNSQGQHQADCLATLLGKEGVRPEIILCSDLLRSSQTARILSLALGVPSKADVRLREANYGKLEGLRYEEIIERHGHGIVEHAVTEWDFRQFDGEHKTAVLQRQVEALNLHGHGRERLLVVGHGRALRTLLHHFGYPFDNIQGNYQLIELDYPLCL